MVLIFHGIRFGTSASIKEGDTIVETVDTGSDGHIKFSTKVKKELGLIMLEMLA